MLNRGKYSVKQKLYIRGRSQTGNKSYGLGMNVRLLDKLGCQNNVDDLSVWISSVDDNEVRITGESITTEKVFKSFESRINNLIDLLLYDSKYKINNAWYKLESRMIKLAIYYQYWNKLSGNNAPLTRIKFEKLALSTDIKPLTDEIMYLRALSSDDWLSYLNEPVSGNDNNEFDKLLKSHIMILISEIEYINQQMLSKKKIVKHMLDIFSIK